jgi:hypothetical protein
MKFTALKKGIAKDYEMIKKLKLPTNVLNNKKFFRLNYLSYLIKNKKIDKNLRIIK